MITRVNGFNPKGVTNGTRQESSPVSFAYSSHPIPPHARVNSHGVGRARDRFEQGSPVWKGTSLLTGAVAVMIGYFLLSGARRV